MKKDLTEMQSRSEITEPSKKYEDKSNENFSAQELRAAIEKSKEIIKPQQGDHTVIFWGSSGVGKSTSILLLSGQKMFAYKQYAEIVLVSESNLKEKVFIKVGVQSGTIIPATIEMKRLSTSHERINLWDMPGIGDTRGLIQNILNTYYIHRIFHLQPQVKLAFTMKYEDIKQGDKGNSIKRILKDLIKIGQFHEFKRSTVLLITKSPKDFEVTFLRQIFEDLIKNVQLDSKIKQFLQSCVNGDIPTVLIPLPQIPQRKLISKQQKIDVTQQYQNIFEQFYATITNLKSTSLKSFQGPVMAPEQRQIVLAYIKDTERDINDCFSQFKEGMKLYISTLYSNVIIARSEQTVCQFQKIAKVIQFNNQMASHLRTQKLSFDLASKTINQFSILSRDNEKEMNEIQKLQRNCERIINNLILVDFFITLKFHKDSHWLVREDILKRFYTQTMRQSQRSIQEQSSRMSANIESWIQKKLRQNLASIEGSAVFRFWQNEYKIFPAFYLSITRFNNSSSARNYFEVIQQNEDKLNFQSRQIKQISDIIEIQNKYLQCQPSESFIRTLQSETDQKISDIISRTRDYSKWSKQDSERIVNNLRLRQQEQPENVLKQIQILRENIEIKDQQNQELQQRNNELKQLLNGKKRCCCSVI